MLDFQNQIQAAAAALKAEQELLSSEATITAIVQKWLEQDMDNQLADINWHYHHSPLLRKLLKAPELAAESQQQLS
jgi:hypothetical protein